MSHTILSTHSKAIQKLIKGQMRQEVEELGFDPYDDSGQEEFERRVMDLEQQSPVRPPPQPATRPGNRAAPRGPSTSRHRDAETRSA